MKSEFHIYNNRSNVKIEAFTNYNSNWMKINKANCKQGEKTHVFYIMPLSSYIKINN